MLGYFILVTNCWVISLHNGYSLPVERRGVARHEEGDGARVGGGVAQQRHHLQRTSLVQPAEVRRRTHVTQQDRTGQHV